MRNTAQGRDVPYHQAVPNLIVVKPVELITERAARRGMSFRTPVPFFAIAFGLGWGVIALLILFPQQTEAIFGPMGYTNPLFILAVYSPAIAGIFLVWRHHGLKGLASFFRRITLWRMPAAWWVFLVIGIPAVFYAGAAIKGTIADPFPFSPWYKLLSAFFLSGSPQSAWPFAPYFVGVIAISIILTSMFNAGRGSILIAALYHFQMNGPGGPLMN